MPEYRALLVDGTTLPVTSLDYPSSGALVAWKKAKTEYESQVVYGFICRGIVEFCDPWEVIDHGFEEVDLDSRLEHGRPSTLSFGSKSWPNAYARP